MNISRKKIFLPLILAALTVTSSVQEIKAGRTGEANKWQSIVNNSLNTQVHSSIRTRENCVALGWEWHDANQTCLPAIATSTMDLTCAMLGGKMVSNVCHFDTYTRSSTESGATWTQDLDYTDNGGITTSPLPNFIQPLTGICNVHNLTMASLSKSQNEKHVASMLDSLSNEQVNCNRQIAVFRSRALCVESGQKWVWYKTPKGGIYEGFCVARMPAPLRCCVEQVEAATPYCPPCQIYDMTKAQGGLPPIVFRVSGGGEREPYENIIGVAFGLVNTLPYDSQDQNLVASAWADASYGSSVSGGNCVVDIRAPQESYINTPFDYAWAAVQTNTCIIYHNGTSVVANAPVAGQRTVTIGVPGPLNVEVRCRNNITGLYSCSKTATINIIN